MSILDNLLAMIAEKNDGKEGQRLDSSVDMQYAFGHVPLDDSTAKHCSFQNINQCIPVCNGTLRTNKNANRI